MHKDASFMTHAGEGADGMSSRQQQGEAVISMSAVVFLFDYFCVLTLA